MKPHQRIFAIQFALAFSMGALLARLPDLQVKFGLTEGERFSYWAVVPVIVAALLATRTLAGAGSARPIARALP